MVRKDEITYHYLIYQEYKNIKLLLFLSYVILSDALSCDFIPGNITLKHFQDLHYDASKSFFFPNVAKLLKGLFGNCSQVITKHI